MEEIRRLTKEDYDAVFDLTQFAFQYTIEEDKMEQRIKETDTHTIWGYTIDGEVAGKVHNIPLHIFVNGKEISTGGVGGVSTWPEYRRSGIAKQLMYRALVDMREKGQVISFLHPFHVGFYRKLGWELVINQRKYSIPTNNLKKAWQTNGYVRRIDKDIPLLDAIYRHYAKRYNGMLVREQIWWENKVLADDLAKTVIAYNEQREAEGYLIYKVRDNIFTVIDLAHTTANSYRLLYEFISNHDSMAETVNLTVPDNDPLSMLLDNPRFDNQLHPYFMGRIVDVQGFLEQLPVTAEKVTFTIYIEDEFLLENSGTYTVRAEDGVMSITKVVGKVNPSIECSIQQLTVICLGHHRPKELLALELITGERHAIDQLERLIPASHTFLADFF